MLSEKLRKVPVAARVVRVLPNENSKTSVRKDDYDALYEEFKPLLIAKAVCGSLPYKRTSGKKCESTFRSWNFLYWVIHFTLMTVIGVDQLIESSRELMSDDTDFSARVEHFMIFSVIFLLLFPTPLCVLYERKAIMELMNSWPALLEQFEITLGEKFTPSFSKFIKIIVWMEPPFLAGTIFTEKNVYIRGKYVRYLMYESLFLASNYLMMIWFFAFLEMENIAIKIEKAIEKISTRGPYTLQIGYNLEDLRLLWLRLAVTVQQTGEAFSLSVFTLVSCLVVVFIISWFSVIYSFSHPEFRNVLDHVTVGIVTGLMFLFFCEPAHRVTEAVGGKIVRALSFMQTNHLPLPVQQQVREFKETIQMNYPTVSLGGLTSVDRTWLPSVGASVITYLIVLVQFQSASP